ncbi:septum-promoting GTP-binding protein 1 isoform X2 [Rhodamnia argentea]|uniref:Septum-promoting GTP-binding protein 1 isoform X2 n=1 Tax=Rhodamnia argentea TaxID=178133 RepID=A0A8B8QIA8_9MYRT|nr:septum-promoting GTP-binding protein 1 isoform X2 [Rhodamnia argentea]
MAVRFDLRRRIQRRFSTLRRCICRSWHKILACPSSPPGKRCRYRMLPVTSRRDPASSRGVEPTSGLSALPVAASACRGGGGGDGDSDLVALKIGLLGDQQIGKTSFVVNFVGDEKEEINCSEMKGLNLMDKTLLVNGARISYSIWEVEGDGRPDDHVPIACKDCVAILFMFDLTSRCTLNSVISWYQQARRWNQTAIPIIVGTKFDDFIQLPIDLQWTIASQVIFFTIYFPLEDRIRD